MTRNHQRQPVFQANRRGAAPRNYGHIVEITCVCLMILVGAVRAHEKDDFPIEPHAHTQALLAKWDEADTKAEREEWYRLLGQLCALAEEDKPRFVEQGLYFICHMPPEERVKGLMIYRLFVLCMVQERDIAQGTSRFLFGDHERLRELSRDLFQSKFQRRNCKPDFSPLRDLVTGDFEKAEVSLPLRRMMFEMSPSAAFLLFHTEAEGEVLKLRRGEHTISTALFERNMVKQEREYATNVKNPGLPDNDVKVPRPWELDAATTTVLRELATSKHWWARMFVAEIMVQVKDFRDANLLKRLADDENELVRQSVASIENPDPLRAGKVDR